MQAVFTLRWAGMFLPDHEELPGCLSYSVDQIESSIKAGKEFFYVPGVGYAEEVLENTYLRSAENILAARQRASDELFGVCLELARPEIQYSKDDFMHKVKNNLHTSLINLTGRLDAFDWLLGYKADWDVPDSNNLVGAYPLHISFAM